MTETKEKKCVHKFTVVVNWKCHDMQNGVEGRLYTICQAICLRCEKCSEVKKI